ncbi:hypothetical protein EDB81DRAFT_806839, partial [Dactylonectria macrodidyma]
ERMQIYTRMLHPPFNICNQRSNVRPYVPVSMLPSSSTWAEKSTPTIIFTTFCLFKRPAPDSIGLQTKMITVSDQMRNNIDKILLKRTSEDFGEILTGLGTELEAAKLPGEEDEFRDDWDLKTLLTVLSGQLGSCVKMYGYRIRMASRHKAADATSVGSSMPAATASKVVSNPRPPLTKAAPPKRGERLKQKDAKTIGGQCGQGKLPPSPTPAVPAPEKPPGRSNNSQPSPLPEPPVSQGAMKSQPCITKENSTAESPAAQEEEGPPVKKTRGRPKQRAAEGEGGLPGTAKRGGSKKQAAEPRRRSTRPRASRSNGEH